MGAGAQARVVGRLWEMYDYFWQGISTQVSVSRRTNGYCRPQGANRESLFGVGTKTQYLNGLGRMMGRGAINLGKFRSNGTVEFRAHQGTVNGQKIVNWALLNHKMLSFCCTSAPVDFRNYPPTLDGLLDMINCGSDLRTALELRASELPPVSVTERMDFNGISYATFQAHSGSE